MTIDLRLLGSKLVKYREQLQETVADVSTSTGIGSDRIDEIEKGKIEPTGDEILILADHYRCDFKYFISNEKLAPFEQTETLYRAHGSEFSKDDRRAVQDFLYLCETEDLLMRELGQKVKSFDFSPEGKYYKGHAEEAASKLRSLMGHPENSVPRDIYAEFRSIGVHIFRRKLGNSAISGLFIHHPTAGKCALVNYSEDVYRQRFSAAHEMAHAIFDSDKEASVSFERQNQADLVEVRANRFASCYLMPPTFLKKLPDPSAWSESVTIHWANQLRVSCAALAISLKEANLIDEITYSRISKLRVPSEDKIDPELPLSLTQTQRLRKAQLLERGLSDHYVKLCLDAYSAGTISQGRLAEALLCSPAELLELARLYGQKLHGH